MVRPHLGYAEGSTLRSPGALRNACYRHRFSGRLPPVPATSLIRCRFGRYIPPMQLVRLLLHALRSSVPVFGVPVAGCSWTVPENMKEGELGKSMLPVMRMKLVAETTPESVRDRIGCRAMLLVPRARAPMRRSYPIELLLPQMRRENFGKADAGGPRRSDSPRCSGGRRRRPGSTPTHPGGPAWKARLIAGRQSSLRCALPGRRWRPPRGPGA